MSDGGRRSVSGRDISNSTLVTGDIILNVSNWPDSHEDTLRAYFADQFEQDRRIRFKQAELDQALLVEMFVDVPLELVDPPYSRKAPTRYGHVDSETLVDAFVADVNNHSAPPGAAEALLWPNVPARIQIVAGPGRGKSTILQYVCQSYRAVLLGNREYLAQLPRQHVPKGVRLPFRIDLRDFGNWLDGGTPYGEDTPSHSRSLEGFIAYSVSHFSGGRSFSVDDFQEVVNRRPSLIALDGLDEMASIELRQKVVEELDHAYSRLQSEHLLNVRMVLTTRPSANPASPVLEGYLKATLGWLPPGLAHKYVTKWAAQWKLSRQDTRELRAAFERQNDKPHTRELQQSLMQLAILLYLLHTHGESLPDQRTLLYEDYLRVYFNREAAKTPAVRKNRKLLEDSLGHIAWELHSSEVDSNGGRATAWQLDEWLQVFLIRTGYQGMLRAADVRDLLIERLRILAGPIEGLFEFEVQPMREYFAARYLNDTAPLRERHDYNGRSERFIALCERPYWANVARFFAGFFHSGELTDLVEVFWDHASQTEFGYTSAARGIMGSLVQDRIFSARPSSEERAAEFCLDVLGCRLVLGGGLALDALGGGGGPTTFNPVFARVLTRRVEMNPYSVEGADAAKLLPRLAADADRSAWWTDRLSTGTSMEQWLMVGSINQSFGELGPVELGALVEAAGRSGLTGKYLLLGGAGAMHGDPAAGCLVQAVKNRFVLDVPLDRGLPGRFVHHLNVFANAVDITARKGLLDDIDRLIGDCWASRYLTILHVVKRPGRKREKSIVSPFTDGSSLARREKALVHASRESAKWWSDARKELREPVDIVTWIVSLTSLAPEDVLCESLDVLAESLFDLPAEWSEVAARDARMACSRKVDLARGLSGVGSLRGVICILLLVDRLPAKMKKRALKLATGSKEVMMATAALGEWASMALKDAVFSSTEDPSFRAHVVEMLSAGKDDGRLSESQRVGSEPLRTVRDSEIAILRNPTGWPIKSVLDAEARVARRHEPEPLSRLAATRGWFVQTARENGAPRLE